MHTRLVTTGWGNEQSQDAVRRTLRGGSSGRAAVLVIAAGTFALGIYAGNLFVSVPFGIAATAAAVAVIRATVDARAARRLERRHTPR